ncbi:c-type cytochrome [Blastochloris viridis]|uniref:Cytochrome C553 (Soluble cytochrome f) n=1 Tax=Blastochloris viridis TaxID=1079 RepID=A0A0H5BGI9_BLAVI|nr:c-type cytochrome [Blastochloris viridis]ALK09836.1 Cytochrome subunit of sulfide dehydrogenase [Blastochloris viridis]BAS00260.1 cytochrome C553 (soluble cytochrome f) [Blastochloris viridis]CUU42499.1 Flavocytochrome c cytochrome subunit [Blastochloris viridis]
MSNKRLFGAIVAAVATMVATSAMADTKSSKAAARTPAPLLAQACAGCHGQNGEGQNGTPILAGYDRNALVQVWGEFRNNQRPAATIMARIARGYSDQEVATLADYFAAVKR